MQQTQLPVKLPNNFTVTFFYALPLACLLADPHFYNWYNMNYIDFIGLQKDERYEMLYTDAISYIGRGRHTNNGIIIDEFDLASLSLKTDIIDLIKQNITDLYYMVVFLDEEKIPDSPFQNKHEYLIYGFDDDRQVVNAVGMNKARRFDLLEFDYATMKKAFDSYVQKGGESIRRICVSSEYAGLGHEIDSDILYYFEREYCEEYFIYKIRTYLSGKVSGCNIKVVNNEKIQDIFAGIDTGKAFIDYVNRVRDNKVRRDFNMPFYFTCHKQGIYDRLIYAYQKTEKSIYQRTAEQYKKVVEDSILIKNLHIKFYKRDKYYKKTDYCFTENEADNLIFSMQRLMQEERRILYQI